MKYLVPHTDYPLASGFDSLFNDIFGDWGVSNSRIPPVDITEHEKDYVLEAELPGYKQDDVKVDVEKHVLRLSSAKQSEKEEKNGRKRLITERCYQKFERAFSLPEDIDEDNIEGEFADGVLTITMPKKEIAQPKKIEVKIKNN